MSTFLRAATAVAITLAAALAAAPAGGQEALAFARRPYLQQLGPRSVIIVWRTTLPAAGSVRLTRGGEDPRVIPSPGPPATRHQVLVDGLEPETGYGYRVTSALPAGPAADPAPDPPAAAGADGITEIDSGELSFRTTPPADRGVLRVAVVGDAGAGTPAQLDVRGILEAIDPHVILITGDIVYPYGSEAWYQERFFDVYGTLLSHSCVYPALGNHDVSLGYDAYLDQFVLPVNDADGTERYYSVDLGAAHIVALDSFTDVANDSAQLEWLERDLAAAARPWKILFFHHPVYTTGPHTVDPAKLPARRALEPLLDRFGVDLVLAGHDHIYERTYPVRGGIVHDAWQGNDLASPRGTIHVVTGGGGQILYPRVGRDDLRYSAFFAAVHHAIDLTISPERLLMRVRTASGALIDPVVIRKDVPRPPLPMIRGDATGDRQLTIADPIAVLSFLFLGERLDCPASGDWNASGIIGLTDAVGSLTYLFLGGPPPPAPFPGCGPAPGALDSFCLRAACAP